MADWLDPQFVNLIPNPDFASGVGSWVLQNITATAEADSEGTYGAITCLNTSNAMYAQGTGTSGIPVNGGKPYAVALRSETESVARLLSVRVYWYASSGAALTGSDAYTQFPIEVSEGTEGVDYTEAVLAPATAAFSTLWIRWQDATGSEVHKLRHVALYELPVAAVDFTTVLTNYLANPSFDFPTLTNWTHQGSVTAVRDASVSRRPGGASMLVTRINTNQLADVVASDAFSLTVNKPHRLSGWFKRKNPVDTHVGLLVRGGFSHDEKYVITDDNWHRLSFIFTPTGATCNAYVGLWDSSLYADQACYVDDVCLVQEAVDSKFDFTGDTPDNALYQYSWSGSRSVMSKAVSIEGQPITAVNLIKNPSFRLGSDHWHAGNGGSMAVVDTDEGKALQVSAGLTTYGGAYTDNATTGFPVVPGKTYYARARYAPTTTARAVQLLFYTYDAAGNQISSTAVDNANEFLGGRVTLEGSVTAPDGAVYGAVYPIFFSPVVGEKHLLDRVLVSESSTPVEFFSGDDAAQGVFNYAWRDVPNGSASYQYVVPAKPDFGTLDKFGDGGTNWMKYPAFEGGFGGFLNNSGVSVVDWNYGLQLVGDRCLHVIAGMENWGLDGKYQIDDAHASTRYVTPGNTYTYSIYVLSRTDQDLCLVDYATNPNVFGPTVHAKAWEWTRLTLTRHYDATDTLTYISVRDPNRTRTIDEIWLSAYQIEYGSEATPFFYGDSADDRFYTYEWTGTPGASASLRVAKDAASIEVISEPDVVFEIAWTDNYGEPKPTWTDITDRVQGFDSRLGRSTEIGAIEAGTVNLTLDNTDGAFTPGNPNSPFYPNVRPRRQVRVRVNDGTDPDAWLAPALINEVLNPAMIGDAIGCGYLFAEAPKTNFLANGDEGTILWGGDVTLTAHAGTDGTVVPFPCSPGDHVSAVFQDYPTGFDATSSTLTALTATVEWFDGSGNSLGTVVGTASASYKVETRCQVVNAVAPSGAAGYTVTCAADAADALYQSLSGLAVYNTAGTAYNWPDGIVSRYHGAMRNDAQTMVAWEGVPNASRSLVYFAPATSSVIARGYVQDWSPAFSGLTSDLTVPVTDWLSGFGDDPLVHPYEWEVTRRQPADLYRFNEDSGATRFVNAYDPTSWASQKRAYENGDVYTVSGSDRPNVEGGDSSLLPDGLPNESAIRANGQSVYTSSNQGDFWMGVCVEVPIPVIEPDKDSFSFAFVWKLFEKLQNNAGSVMEPQGFVLHDSRTALGKGAELSFVIDASGNRLVRLRNNAGTRFDYLTGQDDGSTMFCGFSWDAVGKYARVAMTPVPTTEGTTPTAALEEGTGSFFEQGGAGSGNFASAASILAGVRFDRLCVLGYADATSVGGFADQAIQYLARWDRALNSGDMLAIINTADGLSGHYIDERLDYILDSVNWPHQLRAISQSTSKVPSCGWDNGTAALDWLRSTSETALGSFYVDADGRVRFADRKDRANAVPVYVFDHDSGTGVEAGLTFKSSEDDVTNVAEIDNAYGIKTTVTNEASIAEFGRKTQSVSLRLLDDNEAVQYGYHLVNRYGEPHIRIDAVSFNPAGTAWGQLWAHATGVRIGDMVTCSGLPDTAPANSMDFFVESVSHTVIRDGSRLSWVVTLDLSPSDLWRAWVLGDPVLGVLGETTRVIF